jgi:signal transduction histidine kinase
MRRVARWRVGGRALANIGTGQAALRLNVAEPGQALPVLGEAAKLRQVFLNLLSNAMKFTEAGGQVTVAASRVASGCVTLTVTNTGIDMSKDDIAVALAPFGQVDSRLARRFEGTGLGLPLAKALVELHGGVLAIESESSNGTIVTVVLPLAAGGAVTQPPLLRAAS